MPSSIGNDNTELRRFNLYASAHGAQLVFAYVQIYGGAFPTVAIG